MPYHIVNSHDGLEAARQDELCMALIQVPARLNPVQVMKLGADFDSCMTETIRRDLLSLPQLTHDCQPDSLQCTALWVILDVTPRLPYDLIKRSPHSPTTRLQCEQRNRLNDV